jgi:hypothetical protein
VLSIFLSVVLVSFPSANAFLDRAEMPVCLDDGQEMQIDNDQILKYKSDTKNQFQARGFIEGTVIAVPEVMNKHDHFAISIGPGPKDTIEVIYNNNPEFGPMPSVQPGDPIVVCGDYITSYAKSGRYEASPEGAIIHWVHYNPGNRDNVHEHGFIYFSGSQTLVGFDDAPPPAWQGAIGRSSGSSSRDRSGGYNGGNRPRKGKHKRHFGDFSGDEACTDLEDCA